ncbi:MAG: UvrD-helicase domain-containing protein [Lentisphaeria bacterium]|nr:UvrD-helicase domain-containing protein [Lentisphaeria bacterium]
MSGAYLDRLNPQQREAATHTEGPLLVLAGAGTGKTSVITARIAFMIDCGIPADAILGVTFTNKAAREMKERLQRLIDPAQARKVTLGTFHSFCGRILRKHISLAGNYNSSFTIADESDQKSIIRQAAAELGFSKDELPTDVAASFISNWKNKLWWPEQAKEDAMLNHPGNENIALVYERYQQMLELQNVIDFDDMLMLTLRIFENSPETLKKCQETYRYLLVDEYQDTNTAQFQIVKLLAGERMNLCVVGDDDQSIYAWRGADISNILDFPKIFPGTKEIKLEQNYRSTNRILDAANAVIGGNSSRYDKNLWSAKGTGEILRIVKTPTGEEEARFVVNTIRNFVARGERSYSDFAILYRSNHLSRLFEQEFRRAHIRPKIVGGQEFFQRKEVKDAATYLKLIINERDEQGVLRIIGTPPRGIGDKAILRMRDLKAAAPELSFFDIMKSEEFLSTLTAKPKAAIREFVELFEKYRKEFEETEFLAETARNFLVEIGYLNGLQRIYKDLDEANYRQENVYEFLSYLGSFALQFKQEHEGQNPTLQDFVETYSLMDDNDRTEEDDEDAPVMSTVHASKGLEYPVVFIVGMENKVFPHERSLNENGLEEERRLFYVAITRAREELFMTYAGERFRFKEFIRCVPSPFLREIPEDISERNVPDDLRKESTEDEKMKAYEDILRMLDDDDD